MEKNTYTLIDVWRERAEYPDLKRKVRALARRYAPSAILIENAGPGMNLLQDLRAEDKLVPWPIGRKPKGSKEERMVADAAKIEAGHVVLPKDAPWLPAYLNELLAFPNGRHDDQVDSTSRHRATPGGPGNWSQRRHAGRPEWGTD